MTKRPPQKRVTPYLLAGIALLLMLAALFPRTFFLGEVLLPAGLLFDSPPWSDYTEFPNGDLPEAKNKQSIESFLMFNMFYTATDLALSHGEWPLWNPLEFGGLPLLANCQSAVIYPPRLLHSIFDRYVATTLFVILKLWLCGFNAFICARVFGLRPLTAMMPAVAWMLSGYNTTWAYWADPDVAAWLPLQVASAELLSRGCSRRGGALMALSSTLMLLGGHPESAFTMSAGTGLYLFARIAFARNDMIKAMLAAAMAWAFTLVITAPQTLPFLEYLPESQTYASRASEASHDLHFFPVGAWICLFVPRFFGTNLDGNFWTTAAENQNFVIMAYAGIAVWILAGCGLADCIRRRISVAVALLVPAALSAALAVNTPMLNSFHALPLMDSIWGCWFLGFPMFAIAMMAGFGWESISNQMISRRGAQVLIFILVTMIAIVAGFYVVYRPVLEKEAVLSYVHVQLCVATIVTLLALVLNVLVKKYGPRRGIAIAMMVLLGADLVWAARNVHPSSPHRVVLFETNLTNVLKAQPDRVHADIDAGIPTGLLQGYGIEQVWGYDGILPARWWRFLAETDMALVERMAGVRYVITAPDAEPKGLPIDGVGLHERLNALPRAFLSRSVVSVNDEAAIFARMREPDFDPKHEVLTTASVALDASEATDELGTTKLIARTSNKVIVDVEVNDDCALVLSDAYYPGWHATIDSEPVEIFPAYHAFRGVVVPEGPHRVEFEYAPRVFRLALWASLAAMAISAILSLAILRRRPRP